MKKKKIVFLTGTRADFGKIKSLILGFQKKKNLELVSSLLVCIY